MRKPRSTLAVVAFLLATAASFTPAQYSPGDVVVADQYLLGASWPLWGITPQGQVYTVTSSLSFFGWSIAPAPDNRSLWVSGAGRSGAANARIAPDGTIVNFNVDPKRMFSGIDVDGGGNAIVSDRNAPQILKYAGTTWTTLYLGAPFGTIHGAGIDLTTGDLIVFNFAPNAILRATLAGPPAVSTVFTPVLPAFVGAGLHHDPETGDMIGAWATGGRLGPQYSAIYRLTLGPRSALTTMQSGVAVGIPSSIDRDPSDGQYVVASATAPAAVLRFDARNNAVTTIAAMTTPRLARPYAATVAGSRHLCARGEAKPGKSYNLLVSSPGEPGAGYVVALSLGFRPGVRAAGRKIYLRPDPLFFFSLTNSGIFSNFQGVLGAGGEAIATVAVPNVASLTGLRFFAAAVTVVNARISVISDTLGVTIR